MTRFILTVPAVICPKTTTYMLWLCHGLAYHRICPTACSALFGVIFMCYLCFIMLGVVNPPVNINRSINTTVLHCGGYWVSRTVLCNIVSVDNTPENIMWLVYKMGLIIEAQGKVRKIRSPIFIDCILPSSPYDCSSLHVFSAAAAWHMPFVSIVIDSSW